MKSIFSQNLLVIAVFACTATFAAAENKPRAKKHVIEAHEKDFYAKHVSQAVGFCLASLKNNGLNTQAILDSGYKKRRKFYSIGFKVKNAGVEHPPLLNNRKISVGYNNKGCSVNWYTTQLGPYGKKFLRSHLNFLIPVVIQDIKRRGYSGGNTIKVDRKNWVRFTKGGQEVLLHGNLTIRGSVDKSITFFFMPK